MQDLLIRKTFRMVEVTNPSEWLQSKCHHFKGKGGKKSRRKLTRWKSITILKVYRPFKRLFSSSFPEYPFHNSSCYPSLKIEGTLEMQEEL